MSNSKAIIKAKPSSRRGAILVIFALTFSGLLLFLGLVVDGGIIYFERRKAQAAADAGAYAGALELLHGNNSWIDDAAKADTKMNGFDDDETVIVITVNNPPLTGSAAGDGRRCGQRSDLYSCPERDRGRSHHVQRYRQHDRAGLRDPYHIEQPRCCRF